MPSLSSNNRGEFPDSNSSNQEQSFESASSYRALDSDQSDASTTVTSEKLFNDLINSSINYLTDSTNSVIADLGLNGFEILNFAPTENTPDKGETESPKDKKSETEDCEDPVDSDSETLVDKVKAVGQDPVEALTNAMQNTRVLGFGDYHFDMSPHVDLLADTMQSLQESGATHFAVELSHNEYQEFLDEFNETGELPEELEDYIKNQTKSPESILKLLHAAHDAGLQVVAVDQLSGGILPPTFRDEMMARNIDRVLQEDPKNKVVFFVGQAHISEVEGGYPSAAELLGSEYGYDVTTVYNATSSMPSRRGREISNAIDAPTAVNSDDLEVVPELDFPASGAGEMDDPGAYDMTLFYPDKEGLDEVVKQVENNSSPAQDFLVDLLESNQVISIHGYGNFESMGRTSHSEFDRFTEGGGDTAPYVQEMLAKLKEVGLTHFAVNTHIDDFILESFNQTGSLNPEELLNLTDEQIDNLGSVARIGFKRFQRNPEKLQEEIDKLKDSLGPDTISLLQAVQANGIELIGSLSMDIRWLLEDEPNARVIVWSNDNEPGKQDYFDRYGISAARVLMVDGDYGYMGDRPGRLHAVPSLFDTPVGFDSENVPAISPENRLPSLSGYDGVIFIP